MIVLSDEIRIAGIVKESIVDGPGIRLVVFTQGCRHNCLGCHNSHTHSFDGGELVSIQSIIDIMKENPLLDGITLSGGEPFEQAKALSKLAKITRELGYNIVTYTGYTYEFITSRFSENHDWKELLYNTDILIDGKFEIEKRNLVLKFRGSENQRIIDVNKTRYEGQIVFAIV